MTIVDPGLLLCLLGGGEGERWKCCSSYYTEQGHSGQTPRSSAYSGLGLWTKSCPEGVCMWKKQAGKSGEIAPQEEFQPGMADCRTKEKVF